MNKKEIFSKTEIEKLISFLSNHLSDMKVARILNYYGSNSFSIESEDTTNKTGRKIFLVYEDCLEIVYDVTSSTGKREATRMVASSTDETKHIFQQFYAKVKVHCQNSFSKESRGDLWQIIYDLEDEYENNKEHG